jgi:hypothetical protein
MNASDDAKQARAIGERLAVARQLSKARAPTVFISSTAEDLREYREAARDAALQAGVLSVDAGVLHCERCEASAPGMP